MRYKLNTNTVNENFKKNNTSSKAEIIKSGKY